MRHRLPQVIDLVRAGYDWIDVADKSGGPPECAMSGALEEWCEHCAAMEFHRRDCPVRPEGAPTTVRRREVAE